jgi:preprotein translocase subunit SecF
MKIFKDEPNIDFMSKRYIAFGISGLVIAIGLFLYFTKGFNLGIDFSGGTNIEVSLLENKSVDDIRSALGTVGLEKSVVQRAGSEGNKFFIKTTRSTGMEQADADQTAETDKESVTDLIRHALQSDSERNENSEKIDINGISASQLTKFLVDKGVELNVAEETASKVVDFRDTNEDNLGLLTGYDKLDSLNLDAGALKIIKEFSYLGGFTFLSVEMVGPQVGSDLRDKATLATVWAMIGMLVYIGFRFRFIFGIAAVITLLHDVLVCLTFILLFNIEVSLPVVAGILTLVGYSLNDTIVIFDRVRDNLKLMKRQESKLILDRSINQTLSRTIVTSGTTFVTVISLFLFGGEVIYSFSFTLLVGIVIGTYSSIFQSCAWLKIWEQKMLGTKKKQ